MVRLSFYICVIQREINDNAKNLSRLDNENKLKSNYDINSTRIRE